MIRLLAAWAGLMLLLLIEVVATMTGAGWAAWGVAPLMIAVVALAFMQAAEASELARIFAVTGLFWAAILLSAGKRGLPGAARHPGLGPHRALNVPVTRAWR